VNEEKINNAEHRNPVINVIGELLERYLGTLKIIMKALKY